MAQDPHRQEDNQKPDSKPKSLAGNGSGTPTELYDSNLRLTLALINASDWYQLAARTGIVWQGAAQTTVEPQFLNLFVELDREQLEARDAQALEAFFSKFQLRVTPAFLREFARNPALRTIPARIQLDPKDPARTTENSNLETLLAELASTPSVTRVRSSIPHGMCLERSLAALELPKDNLYNSQTLTGQKVIVGIIDDGCALAHPDFLTVSGSKWGSRVLFLWDQSQPPLPKDKIWKDDDVKYGRELTKAQIDKALAKYKASGPLDEDAVYKKLRYEVGEPGELATHGTRVMGIAAGNGNSMMGWRGVAPEADIIFVQLPPDVIREAPQLLSKHIVDGAGYIFDRALALGQPAVVNISFGGYSGPHDGTSPWEAALDELLDLDERAIVVSAGNGFEADCHATGTLKKGEAKTLRWMLQPWDTTINDLEIWYNGDAELELTLKAPDGTIVFGPTLFCARQDLTYQGQVIGSGEHINGDANNGDNSALIALGPTYAEPLGGAVNAPLALVESGTWELHLSNSRPTDAEYHAWIRRDDLGGESVVLQQSRFAADDASPAYTLCDMATGRRTIAVGAFNAATNEVCAYSASGPTRASKKTKTQNSNPSRKKPDIYAPAEELATGGGVLASASRSAPPWRLNGTSAAAPHVTGIVALLFEYDRKRQAAAPKYPVQPLNAATVLSKLSQQTGIGLILNRRLSLKRPKGGQSDVRNDLVVPNHGPISAVKTLDKI
jgi:subtilisin family serine protease